MGVHSLLHGSQYNEIKKNLNATDIAIVKIKPKTKLLTLIDLFKQYHIAEKYRHCRVMYDDDIIDFPETIIATSKQIANIKIIKYTTGTFIDIIGIDYDEIKKMKEAKKQGEPFVGSIK